MSLELEESDLRPGDALPGKTEWEDALIKHGIVQAQKAGRSADDDFLEEVERRQNEDPHAHKSLEELDDLEDDLEDDVLAGYRARRMEELRARQRREIYGDVYHIREQDFIKEVSQAPEETFVVLHLWAPTQPDCLILDNFMKQTAQKFRAVKFCKIRAQEAIRNFPTSKCPTMLVYKASHIVKQIEGIGVLGGQKMNALTLEWALAQPITIRPAGFEQDVTHQILTTDLTSNPLNTHNRLTMQKKGTRRDSSDDDDSDED